MPSVYPNLSQICFFWRRIAHLDWPPAGLVGCRFGRDKIPGYDPKGSVLPPRAQGQRPLSYSNCAARKGGAIFLGYWAPGGRSDFPNDGYLVTRVS